MKTNFLFFALVFIAWGCQNKNSASTDPQQNRYYRIYNEIYTGWSKIPLASTQQKLNAYLREFPENANAQMLAGNIAFSFAEYAKAVEHYRAAIAIQPQQAILYSALGSAFNVQNKTDSAEKYLMKAISMNDSSSYTFLNASLLYLKMNNKEKCRSFADSAFAKGNISQVTYSGLCFIFNQLNETEKSREFYTQAVAIGLKDTLAFKKVLDGKLKLEDYYRTNY